MIQIVRHVFCKDGRELLRDRRTIFVNAVLPVLLYPVLALFGLQVMQLTKTDPSDLPRVATIAAPDALNELLEESASKHASDTDSPATAPSDDPNNSDTQIASNAIGYVLAAIDNDTDQNELANLAGELRDVRDRISESTQADSSQPLAPELAAERDRLQAKALTHLRTLGITAVIVANQPDHTEAELRLVVISDDAHRYHPQLARALNTVLKRYERQLIDERLTARDLPTDLVHPMERVEVDAAPTSEAFRVRIAGIIPMLLVMMALSGAFYPALDLIAGERERGTLESLLAWPGDRRAIFLGKLLVVICAALVSVVLNLTSLGFTAIILGNQSGLGGEALGNLTGSMSLGAGVLALCLLALFPLVVTLAAVALAIAGFAASFKEAQNYLSPLLIVVMVPAAMTMIPAAKPTLVLDLVPVVGPLLVLKESLQSPSMPWGHLLLATAGSAALAWVVVAWSIRLFDQERFLYPGLVRAGWGRFRKWGRSPAGAGGLEVLAVYAVALGLFLFVSPSFQPLGPVAQVVLPLVVAIGLPPLAHWLLGAYRARESLYWAPPTHFASAGLRTLILIPIGIVLSISIGILQQTAMGEAPAQTADEMTKLFAALREAGGLPLLILCVAITPGICEELLCRGTVLAGLRRSLGPVAAVVLSAFLFAALHGSPYRFVPQMALGAVLAVLVMRTGSIWTAMIVHAAHNGILVTLDEIGAIDPTWQPSAWTAAGSAGLAGLGSWLTLRCWGRSKCPPEAETTQDECIDHDALQQSPPNDTPQSAGPAPIES